MCRFKVVENLISELYMSHILTKGLFVIGGCISFTLRLEAIEFASASNLSLSAVQTTLENSKIVA